MTMPIITHPRINNRPVLLGDRVRVGVIPDPLTVVAVHWSDIDREVWIDLFDGVYTLTCTVAEITERAP